MPTYLSTTDADFEARFTALLGMKREEAEDVDQAVAAIIADVRARGDAAVIDLTARFDRLTLTPRNAGLFAGRDRRRMRQGLARRPRRAGTGRRRASAPITPARCPRTRCGRTTAARTLGWRWTPVSAAGLYVPGGIASYPSSVLMNAIPAKVAGVERLAIACPTPGGVVNPLVLLAARIAGVDEIYRIGGAQAIAALAYGTETIAAGRQDHRPRQRLCRRRQAPGLRPRRHRHDRRPVRDSGHRRRRQ